jgi:hypothetical protein
LSGHDWSGIDELFPNDVYAKVQAFNRAHPQQDEIFCFGEDDIIGGSRAGGMDYCVPDITLDPPAIRHDELLSALHRDIERFQ